VAGDNSFDYDDLFFGDEERQYFKDVEDPFKDDKPHQRGWPLASQPASTTRSRIEGVDESEDPPAWWIRREGQRILRETFSDGDEPRYGSPIETSSIEKSSNLFRMFPTSIRLNHWF